ncbi:Zinc finger, RING-type,U box domain [Cinara cedri]|uniref:Zinc finger, RING-type,U box domain n=1 Tax=Cinara cedri TaxID=506608 RepID=A0A5E4MAY2_9HEMI|nr:Zinc finger, RING-type,U box domain [Cinara cedri]
MLINVCDPIINANIKLDGNCISREDYAVENLISSNESVRKRGFLCETFIRPPISLTVSFPFVFDIRYVVIGTRVGGQKSSGFQVSSGRNDNVQKICSIITEKESIVFHDNNTDLSTFGNDYEICCFNISASRCIRSAEKLSVRIFKTANSIPAISKLEIWGKISFSVPKEIRQAIISNWVENKNPKKEKLQITHVQSVTEKYAEKNNIFKICDDFLDSITFEVMNFPMVLPSGKYVDISTIEKCSENDSMYGRMPCDPFTGISYTETLKPLSVPELKGRIDSFLLKHSNNEYVKSLPRVVGKRSFSFYTERQAKTAKVQCNTCNNCYNNNMYCLPCKHYQCKNCLQTMIIECKICHKNFNRSQVEKHHENQ